MPEADQMTPSEASEVLGVPDEASEAQIERAYSEKLEALEKKVAQAATTALRSKYRTAIDRLKAAKELLLSLDAGHDLPSMSILEEPEPVRAAPAPAPAPAATPMPTPAPAPEPAPPQEALPPPQASAPAPTKAGMSTGAMIGLFLLGGVAAIGAVVVFAMMIPSKYAGTYTQRVKYETVMFDFSLDVDGSGKITGFNKASSGASKPISVTGTVDDEGNLTAKSVSGTTYTGKIEGDDMKISEDLGKTKFTFTLVKGKPLPSEPSTAQFAGKYQTRITYPNGTKFDYEITISKTGELTGTCTDVDDKSATKITGTVSDYGKIKATGGSATYTGSVSGDALQLEETLPSGKVMTFSVSKK